MLPIVKTVYIFALKNCAWFGLHFSIFSLGHVKNPNEIKNRQIHLLEIIINNNKSPNMRSFLNVNRYTDFTIIDGTIALPSPMTGELQRSMKGEQPTEPFPVSVDYTI